MSRLSLRLTEIFYSLQGESNLAGLPTVFVRLTGCPLRCTYCDTSYAFEGGERWEYEDILAEIKKYRAKYICVTGGEPLAQANCYDFLRRLCDEGYLVSLETSGAMTLENVDDRVIKIMDLKTPSSNECSRNLWSNIELLNPQDQVKFVIGDDDDFDWLEAKCLEYGLSERVADILVSPVHQTYTMERLAERVLQCDYILRFQTQLHKIIWDDARGK